VTGKGQLVVIDYDAGNLYNVGNALKFLGADYVMSGDPELVARAGRVILPGVGSARAAMASLARQGLSELIPRLTVPFLGICLGMQLLFEESEEDHCPCLGLLEGAVRRFDRERVKVPHIGWNRVDWKTDSPQRLPELTRGLESSGYFYFVHSYFAPLHPGATLAVTEYDRSFSSAVRKDNFLGLQFHPERSGGPGLRLLRNFLSWEGGLE
jgi:imidazole glycerol-phosphate synthase subunit HisH